MRKFAFILLVAFIPMFTSASKSVSHKADSYNLAKIYYKEAMEYGAKAIDAYGKVLTDIEYILTPVKLDVGRYEVELSRLDYNYYKIVGTDFVLETRGCYEYASYDEAIINIKYTTGYTLGEVIFL